MGEVISLTAADGFTLSAYRTCPENPQGGLVVVQEIFGVNSHIRNVVDRFAAQGYDAIAPAIFDRIEPGFECGYSEDEIATARGFIPKVDWDKILLDVDAARAAVAAPVGIVGYCLGGSVAFLAGTRLDGFSAAIGYYGGKVAGPVVRNVLDAALAYLGQPPDIEPPDAVASTSPSGEP